MERKLKKFEKLSVLFPCQSLRVSPDLFFQLYFLMLVLHIWVVIHP